MLARALASCARSIADYKHPIAHNAARMHGPSVIAAWYLFSLLLLAASQRSPKPDRLLEFQRALPKLRIPNSAFIPKGTQGRRRALSLPKERVVPV